MPPLQQFMSTGGANGVVMIKPKAVRPVVLVFLNFPRLLSISSVAKRFDLLDRDEFLAGITQYGGDAASSPVFGDNTDWQGSYYETSISETKIYPGLKIMVKE